MARRSADASVMKIAQVMHEAVRAWQKANGQNAAPPWSRAPKWMREASQEAVIWRMKNPGASSAAQHEQWMAQKKAEGWTYGKIKSGVKKTHPMLAPYRELPEIERRKDALVAGIIDALSKKAG